VVPGDSPISDEPGAASLDAVLARRSSRRRRAFQLATVIAALLVVSALVLGQYRAAQSAVAQSTPAGPSVVTVIESTTTWGTLTVNGRHLPGPPPQTVTLSAFRDNVIALDAPPFAPVTCHVVVVPLTEHGTPAPEAVTTGNECEGWQGQEAAAVGFNLTGDELPAAQRAAVRQAITVTLAAQEVQATVPAGEYYAAGVDPQGRVVALQANAPLDATRDIVPPPLSYSPPPRYSCGDLGLGCFDQTFDPGTVPAGRVWSIQEPLFVRWRFTDQSGAHVGEAAFGPLPYPPEFLISLTSGTAWQVMSVSNPIYSNSFIVQSGDLCGLAQMVVSAYGIAQSESSGLTANKVGPLGCTFTLDDTFNRPNNGRFVWRFGALLAADARAHQLLPEQLIAPAREIAEAGNV
jgi:hypothetical protein